MSQEHENYVEYLIHVREELTGISLEQLGCRPRPEDLSNAERNGLETWDLDRMEPVTPEQRDKSLFQAKLLAGTLWEASAVLIDQLFEDIAELRERDGVTRQDIAGSFVLSGLPPRHAGKYTMSGSPSGSWSLPQTRRVRWSAAGPARPAWPRNWRSGACWTRSKSSRTCTGLTLPTAGAADWKNTCSKTPTVTCFTRTRWTASKATPD
jgi:hypothetical protein